MSNACPTARADVDSILAVLSEIEPLRASTDRDGVAVAKGPALRVPVAHATSPTSEARRWMLCRRGVLKNAELCLTTVAQTTSV